ncbi:hypothetical protein [Clostridium sp. KNHs216]|uniref:hypothetical protein n=1 Tax=Clostridium sp. KNHs216 TaxID=1550235 RepID=UPI001FAB0049|nr:hypothetical protein [Clostridium sp. KNHs216]
MAALGEISSLPELTEPPILIRTCTSVIVLHFYAQTMVLSARDREVKVRDAGFQALVLQVLCFDWIAPTAIRYGMQQFKIWILCPMS